MFARKPEILPSLTQASVCRSLRRCIHRRSVSVYQFYRFCAKMWICCRFKFSRSALVENCGGKSINLSVLVNICGGKIVQHVISYNNENENVKIQNRIERVQHKLNTKTILYRITNVHAQSLSLTCRAGIRCTQEFNSGVEFIFEASRSFCPVAMAFLILSVSIGHLHSPAAIAFLIFCSPIAFCKLKRVGIRQGFG